jgi:hypothetical protein
MKKITCLVFGLFIFGMVGYSQITVRQSTGLMGEPALTSKRLATVYEGEQVTVIEKSGAFWKVDYKGKIGFIHETCLSNYVDPNQKLQQNERNDAIEAKSLIQDSTKTVMSSRDTFTDARDGHI